MAKNYTELEAWGIFIGALVIGIVLTSVFWAFITVPDTEKKIAEEIKQAGANSSGAMNIEEPKEFVTFCRQIDGSYRWDNTGLRECTVTDTSEKNLIVMNLLCKKFNLSMSYGSYGIKCEGTA